MTYEIRTCLKWPNETNKVLEKSEVLLLSRWNYIPVIQDIAIDY